MEAIFARSLDLTYVGPNPAINAYLKSHGEEIRVISGAAMAGADMQLPASSTICVRTSIVALLPHSKHMVSTQKRLLRDYKSYCWNSTKRRRLNAAAVPPEFRCQSGTDRDIS